MKPHALVVVASLAAVLLLGAPSAAWADEPPARARAAPSTDAVGVTFDLLPTVLSAIDGELGGGLQLWYGHRHLKVRLVAAHIAFPDGLADTGWHDQDLDALAGIVDYVFGDHFDGWWVGGGFEHWSSHARTDDGDFRYGWDNWVATVGGGYIWRFYRNVYLEPWAAAHLLFPRAIPSEGVEHRDKGLQGEVSLKLGVFWEL